MDKNLYELHEAYEKHLPTWICTLLGRVSMSTGKRMICGMGVCSCGCGIYTTYTMNAPLTGPLYWEEAPWDYESAISEGWIKAYRKAVSCSHILKSANEGHRLTNKTKA